MKGEGLLGRFMEIKPFPKLGKSIDENSLTRPVWKHFFFRRRYQELGPNKKKGGVKNKKNQNDSDLCAGKPCLT